MQCTSYSRGTVSEHKYMLATHNGCLLIPRGMQLPKELFPDIVLPHNLTEPYRDFKNRKGGSFHDRRSIRQAGICSSVVLQEIWSYITAEEVITLRNAGVFKSSSSTSQSLPRLPSLASLGQTLSSPTWSQGGSLLSQGRTRLIFQKVRS